MERVQSLVEQYSRVFWLHMQFLQFCYGRHVCIEIWFFDVVFPFRHVVGILLGLNSTQLANSGLQILADYVLNF